MATFRIGIPIVPNFDLLDVANSYEVFNWIGAFWKDGKVDVKLVGHKEHEPVTAANKATLLTHTSFKKLEDDQLDMVFVPGGGNEYISNAVKNRELLEFVKTQHEGTTWTASVCTGAFILAKAKILDGLRATTHWFFQRELQRQHPKIKVVNGYPRVVQDGKVATGGGLSSAIDESLWLAGQIAGQDVGKQIELGIQYNPKPPYGTGDPSIADYDTYAAVVSAFSTPPQPRPVWTDFAELEKVR